MQSLPIGWQVVWMGCAVLAVLGGGLSLFLLVTRVLPMTRELRDTSREMLSISLTGRTRDGKIAYGADDMKRIVTAIEERFPKMPTPRRPALTGGVGTRDRAIVSEEADVPEGT